MPVNLITVDEVTSVTEEKADDGRGKIGGEHYGS
jgi:hypothetical protein